MGSEMCIRDSFYDAREIDVHSYQEVKECNSIGKIRSGYEHFPSRFYHPRESSNLNSDDGLVLFEVLRVRSSILVFTTDTEVRLVYIQSSIPSSFLLHLSFRISCVCMWVVVGVFVSLFELEEDMSQRHAF